MNNSRTYFISLIKAFVKNEQPPEPYNINWTELYSLASIHNVGAVIYIEAEKLENKPDAEILTKLKTYFYSICLRSAKLDMAAAEITEMFAKHNIKFAFIKGAYIRDFYPAKEMRSMGDIDLLIRDEDRQRSHELLLKSNYKYSTYSSFKYVWSYAKDGVELEIHSKLIYNNMYNKKMENDDLMSYFERNTFDNFIETQQGCKLKDEFHFLYIVVHMAKHFSQGGIGIRMLLDLPFFVNGCADMDWEYIWLELKKLELDKFAENIFAICNKWFDVSIDGKAYEIENDFYEKLSEMIINGGVFGFYNKESNSDKVLRNYVIGKNAFTDFFKRAWAFILYIFPSCKDMRLRSVWFYDKPSVLLPAAWIKRWTDYLKARKLSAFVGFGNAVKGTKIAKEEYLFFKKLGL